MFYLKKFSLNSISDELSHIDGDTLYMLNIKDKFKLDSICKIKFMSITGWLGYAWIFSRHDIIAYANDNRDFVKDDVFDASKLKDKYYAIVWYDYS